MLPFAAVVVRTSPSDTSLISCSTATICSCTAVICVPTLSALAAAFAVSAFFFICASILPNASLNVSILI